MTTSPAQIASFGFHEVTDAPHGSGFQRPAALPYKHSRCRFAEYLDRIAEAPVSPGCIDALDPGRPGRHLLLTFDDGGKSALYIGEELARRGWTGHFFIVTGRIGERTFLDAAEIRTLRSGGHRVGSHSHTHPDIFRAQPLATMLEEWRVSRERLAQLLGEPITLASVPGGDISRRVLESAARAGLRHLFTSEPWLSPRCMGGSWILGRFVLKTSTTPQRLRELARFHGWGRALWLRRAKVGIRLALPALYRLHVRRTTQEAAALPRRHAG